MMMMRRRPALLVSATCLRPVSRPSGPGNLPRRPGRRAARPVRPSTPRWRRSTTCPIPTRPCATGARCRTAASGDRSAPSRSISTASTSGPAIAAEPIRAPARRSIRSSSSIPSGKVVKSFGAGQILWPHGMDVDKQGNVWVADARVGDRRGTEAVPRCRGQGAHRDQVQPAGQSAAGARHAGRRPAIRRRNSPSPTTC